MSPAISGRVSRWTIGISLVGGLTLLSTSSYLSNLPLEGSDSKGWIGFETLDSFRWGGQKAVPTKPNYCSVKDVVHGKWVIKESLQTMEELFRRYGLSSDAYVRCEPVDTPPVIEEDGSKSWPAESILRRTLAVASPELVPLSSVERVEDATGDEDRCNIAALSPQMLIKRLLRSRLGLILVGDSLTEQHLLQLFNLFSAVPYVRYQQELKVMPFYTISLDVDNIAHFDTTSAIIEEAGVSRERAAQPFIYFWRHHHLLTPEESAFVFRNASEHFALTAEPIGTDWYAEMCARVYHEPLFVKEGRVREEPSVIVLNTGAHWNVGEFGYLPEQIFKSGFARMVEIVDDKIRRAPFALSAYWRPNLPGQIDCAGFDHFDNTRSNLLSPWVPERGAHNYLWFDWMNEIMGRGRALDRTGSDWLAYFSQSKSQTAMQNPRGLFFDAYPMSVKRPDAHHSPPVDCLHWCEVGVPDHWTRLMWHMMVLESISADYA